MDNYETYGSTVGNSYESHGYMQNLDGYQQHVKYSNYRDYQINPSMALWDMIKAPSLSIYLPVSNEMSCLPFVGLVVSTKDLKVCFLFRFYNLSTLR